jgi:hypothetical protein
MDVPQLPEQAMGVDMPLPDVPLSIPPPVVPVPFDPDKWPVPPPQAATNTATQHPMTNARLPIKKSSRFDIARATVRSDAAFPQTVRHHRQARRVTTT